MASDISLNNSQIDELNIAILIEDIVEAKELSDSLREKNIFAHYYEDLNDLWVSLNAHSPDLIIVDVKKMSQGTILFRNHPKVKSNELDFIFYYTQKTQILMNSTFGLNHRGYINGDLNLENQLVSPLNLLLNEKKLIKKDIESQGRISRIKARTQRLTDELESSNHALNLKLSLDKFITNFGEVNSRSDFNTRLTKTFDSMAECFEFTIYELSETRQKLISTPLVSKKYNKLPDVWLNRDGVNGIDDFATEMAYEIVYGVLGHDVVALRIFGKYENPDMLIMLKIDTQKFAQFNWRFFEMMLTSQYRKLLIENSASISSSKTNEFELLEKMDDIYFHKQRSQNKFALLDFNSLVDFACAKHGNRFYWSQFYKDFSNELLKFVGDKVELSFVGPRSAIIAIPLDRIELYYNKVKHFCAEFEYWRHFEDSTLVVTEHIAPEVKFIPASSINALKQMNKTINEFDFDGSSINKSSSRQLNM